MSAIVSHGWLDLLRERVSATSIGAVSREMKAKGYDISTTTISLVLREKYPAKTDKIETLIVSAYSRISCPFLEREIAGAECREFHTRDVPTSSPYAMRHWRACQGCPNRRPK